MPLQEKRLPQRGELHVFDGVPGGGLALFFGYLGKTSDEQSAGPSGAVCFVEDGSFAHPALLAQAAHHDPEGFALVVASLKGLVEKEGDETRARLLSQALLHFEEAQRAEVVPDVPHLIFKFFKRR